MRLEVKSDPSDAKVVVFDVAEGKNIHQRSTPMTVSWKRGAGYFKKAKYLVVDPATGAMWTLDSDDINVALKRQSPLFTPASGLVIALRSDVPPELAGALRPITSQARSRARAVEGRPRPSTATARLIRDRSLRG